MGLSVSRVVWIRDDVLELKNTQSYSSKWEILSFLKKIPKGLYYTVTYTLDKSGPLLVVKKKIMIVVNIRTKDDMGCCFLPKSWDGRRVRRKVTTPIYETN